MIFLDAKPKIRLAELREGLFALMLMRSETDSASIWIL